LPALMLAAMAAPSAGVMIARGDLAVECGYERMAEIQEEILCCAEAAHMPVIWATQVLETLGKTGIPSRAEISDASMGEWMAYVYQQQAKPDNFTGVTVNLSVLDANNNLRPIGQATTDSSGTYTYTWIPDIPGNYKLYANFDGTNGYWPSSAENSFNVMEAHPTASPTPTPAAPMTDTYILASAIAIIIVIAIVGAIIVLMVRKRP